MNYNRYGYVFGNPLSYTDPSGYVSELNEFFRDNWKPIVTTYVTLTVAAGVFVATGGTGAPLSAKVVAAGIYAASAASATSGALGTALNGGSFGDCFIAGTKGAIFGGMSAMATAGIGNHFKEIGLIAKSKFLTEAVRAGTHSATQGAIAVLRGGDFWQGAASGALGSIGASIYGGDNLWVTVAIGSVSGGAGAVIGGAETAEEILFGMATGAIVGALNHYMHNVGNQQKYEYNGVIYDTKEKLYVAILANQAAEQFGITDLVALATAIDGMGLIDKPFQMQGASKGTSILSKGLSKALPQKMPFRLPTISNRLTLKFTNILGRFIGRTIPVLGWGVLVYDVGATFYKTQVIYNAITK